MFRLQQAMKNGDKDEILLFFEEYFNDEEMMEQKKKQKEREQVEHKQIKMRNATGQQISKQTNADISRA